MWLNRCWWGGRFHNPYLTQIVVRTNHSRWALEGNATIGLLVSLTTDHGRAVIFACGSEELVRQVKSRLAASPSSGHGIPPRQLPRPGSAGGAQGGAQALRATAGSAESARCAGTVTRSCGLPGQTIDRRDGSRTCDGTGPITTRHRAEPDQTDRTGPTRDPSPREGDSSDREGPLGGTNNKQSLTPVRPRQSEPLGGGIFILLTCPRSAHHNLPGKRPKLPRAADQRLLADACRGAIRPPDLGDLAIRPGGRAGSGRVRRGRRGVGLRHHRLLTERLPPCRPPSPT